jgi:hypothetical protein
MKFRSQIHKIITEICNKHNIKIESFSDDWNFRLTKNNISYYISGYQFPLDNAPIRLIVDDKAAVSSILKEKKIKCFEHIFFMTKNFNIDIGEKMLKKYKKIVLKPNNGTGGRNVFLITTKNELENAINKLAIYNCICVSPYVEYENEFRAILLKNKVQLIYKKERPFIIGDGINTINYFANKINIIPDEAIDLNTIPAKGKKILLN